MNKIQKAVRLKAWVVNAIQAYADKNGMDFTEAAEFFLENELNTYQYYRKDYEPTDDKRPENDTESLNDKKTSNPGKTG